MEALWGGVEEFDVVVLLGVLSFLTQFYWVLGSAVYSLKFISPSFNDATSYGKLLASSKHGMLLHSFAWPCFYIFGIIWNFGVILVEVYLHTIGVSHLRKSIPFSILLQIQVTRRAYECLFVHKFSSNRMSMFQFISGLSYYGAAPFCAMEMMLPTSDLFETLQWNHILAIFLFVIASCVQHKCHLDLAKLRNTGKGPETSAELGTTNAAKYFIPSGVLFEYISCPHYLSEILIYISFVIFTGGQNVSICLELIFVLMNIAHSALRTHSWYKQKFEDYPQTRRAIIPFIL